MSTFAESNDRILYEQTNLVSDIAGVARFTDPNLINSWGISQGENGLWLVSDNGTGVATIYNEQGRASRIIITIPPPGGAPPGATAAPTGNVILSRDSKFVIDKTGFFAEALFSTEDGTVAAYNQHLNLTRATLVIDNSATGAVYKGLAVIDDRLYLANFTGGVVEVYDNNFKFITSFTDPTLPAGYSPFNVAVLPAKDTGLLVGENTSILIKDELLVAFALREDGSIDDTPGPGHGFIDIFSASGVFIRRLVSQGVLNSPWGLTILPAEHDRSHGFDCGCKEHQRSATLLVGNFGDGKINSFSLKNGQFLGELRTKFGPIVIDSLWGISLARNQKTIFFAAGINDEAHGLFGRFDPESLKPRPCPKPEPKPCEEPCRQRKTNYYY